MAKLALATDHVFPDEPCWGLHEFEERAPDSRGHHRYRVITVVRGEAFYEYREDMGPADTCPLEPFVIPGGVWENGRPNVVETVGRLVEIANRMHAGYLEPKERPAASDLIGGYHDLPDRRRRQRKRQSQFGPLARIQRG